MMAAPNIGSANASMRSTSTPSWRTSSEGVIIAMANGEPTYITTPITVIMPMPNATLSQAKRFISSYLPAPMLWPTSVVAASLTP